MKTTRLAIAAAALLLLTVGCGRLDDGNDGGSGATTGGDDGYVYPTGADDLVLRVSTGGGFVPVEYNLRALPGLSIYGDGRMIVEGPMIEIYPSPALPNLQVTRLTDEAIQAILAEVDAAGLLGRDASYDFPCVTDLPTTTFTVVVDGTTHTTSAYALGFEGSMTGAMPCEGADLEARERLWDLSMRLGDVRSWLPEGSFGREEAYEPTAMRVYVRAYRGQPDLPQTSVEWPLETPLASFGEPDTNLTDTRCGVVEGDDLAQLLPDAQGSNQLTPWTSEGAEFALIFRPLLPDETGC